MDYQAQKTNQKEQRKLKRRVEQIEAELEDVENKQASVTECMHTTNDTTELMDLQAELDELTQKSEALMLEWEELSEQLED